MAKLKEEMEQSILSLPGVTIRTYDGKNGPFSSFVYKEKEFAHFHNTNEIDLRLTKQVIANEGLSHPDNSTYHPKRSKRSPWIELRFTTEQELKQVFNYVRIAVQQIK